MTYEKKLFFVYALIVLGGSALVGAENASAMLDIPTTDTLSVISEDGTKNYDVSDNGDNSWIDLVLSGNLQNEYGSNQCSQYTNSLPYTYRSVTQLTTMNNNGNSSIRFQLAVYFTWTLRANTATVTYSDNDLSYLAINSTSPSEEYHSILWIQNDGTYKMSCYPMSNSSMYSPNMIATEWQIGGGWSGNTKPRILYYTTYSIIYSSGWTGNTNLPSEAPGEPAQPPEVSEATPDMFVSSSEDWFVTFSDRNFLTFDGLPFVCSDELVPALHIELWNRSEDPEVLITTGASSAASQWTYQFEKLKTSTDYRIVSWYECGDEPTFSESGIYDFTIDGIGGLGTIGLNTCIQEEFPFLKWDSCLSGLNDLAATLAFNFANPVNDSLTSVGSANPNACYTMQTLDNWLNTPNAVLCPAFSETVRNTITPFVTFVLGGLVFTYISRSKASVIS